MFFSFGKGTNLRNDDFPIGITLKANLVDNCGNVSFTATATNAICYAYNFGNGSFQTVSTGLFTYKYHASGEYIIAVTATTLGGRTLSKSIRLKVTITPSLVWADEFEKDGLPDTTKWHYDIGTGDNGWGNNELEYYTNRATMQ